MYYKSYIFALFLLFSVNAALAANPADSTINTLVADILGTVAFICSQASSAEITTLTALKVTVSETANEVQAKLTVVTIELAGNKCKICFYFKL